MKLTFDLLLERLLSVPRGGEINMVTVKAGSSVRIELGLYEGRVSTAPAYVPAIQFAIKTAETGALLALAAAEDFTGSGAFYGATLFTNTAELVSWLGNESSKIAVAELTVIDAAAEEGTPPIRSQTLNVRVTNHVLRGDEGAPGTLPDPETWLSARSPRLINTAAAVDGGGVAKLAGVHELVVWNTTRNVWQIIRASGTAGSETLFLANLP